MKLYYSPGACSMAPHIVLREAGFKFDLEKVDIPNKKTADGGDFWKINPKGYVPALKLDDQAILTIGEPLTQRLGPAVELGDLASAAKGPLGMAGFLITARPPVKKPKPAPAETAPPD